MYVIAYVALDRRRMAGLISQMFGALGSSANLSTTNQPALPHRTFLGGDLLKELCQLFVEQSGHSRRLHFGEFAEE
jgi:hypothetical protein